MQYTVIRHDGIRFTLCPPGISEGAETADKVQYLHSARAWNSKDDLVYCGNRTLTAAEINRRKCKEKRAKKRLSPSPASAEAQPDSE